MDKVWIFALFPQTGLKFLKNRNNSEVFEPIPGQAIQLASSTGVSAESTNGGAKAYSVSVNGQMFEVEVARIGELTNVQAASYSAKESQMWAAHSATGQVLNSPLAGNIFKVLVRDDDVVNSGDVVIIMKAMKMETEIRASISGVVSNI